MKTNYVLIDLENVMPKNLELLKGHGFKVVVFVGAKQLKISLEVACAMQMFGSDAEYIRIEGSGPNALDFHIAFYIGYISSQNPDCYFHIISKDTGFDPLIAHLKTRKIYAQREQDISEIPLLKVSNANSTPERIEAIVKFLDARGNAKPRTVKTLSNSIHSLFMKKLDENEMQQIMNELISRGIVLVNGTKVSYQLAPKS